MSRYQKGKTKTNVDFLEQEAVLSGSGIAEPYANLHLVVVVVVLII